MVQEARERDMAEAATRETALREAEAACLRRGATLTPLRRQVL